jgi:membrane protein DedA with SNARE-associated domain
LLILENLYLKFGYLGLVIATFLESIVYLGLYFPGSFIIALAVFFSNGSFVSLLIISILVAITLTITAVINYFFGRYVSRKDFFEKKEFVKESKSISKGLFVSMLHPDLMAFYFFNAGLERQNMKKLIYVPIFMIPYGYLIGFVLSRFSELLRRGLESPNFLLIIIGIWFVASFVFEIKRRKRKSG